MKHTTAEELMRRFSMSAHEENGAFAERHYAHEGSGRADSGSIFYYVAPGEKTAFHRIDCDEYWCFAAGETLDVWQFDERAGLTVTKLGIEENAEPLVYIKKGVIFASRHSGSVGGGTFVTCITVPRFSYDGFEMFSEEYMRSALPQSAEFFDS